jgi:hypothetical protein
LWLSSRVLHPPSLSEWLLMVCYRGAVTCLLAVRGYHRLCWPPLRLWRWCCCGCCSLCGERILGAVNVLVLVSVPYVGVHSGESLGLLLLSTKEVICCRPGFGVPRCG